VDHRIGDERMSRDGAYAGNADKYDFGLTHRCVGFGEGADIGIDAFDVVRELGDVAFDWTCNGLVPVT
jgi:hypothetical protein